MPYPRYVADPSKLDRALERIARAVLDYRVEFLFGAGMSKTSKVPTGYALTLRFLSQFYPPAGQKHPSPKSLKRMALDFPLEAIAEVVERMPGKGRADLTKRLTDALFDDLKPELSAHDVFLSICSWDGSPRVNRLFTTNFDTLLEQAFGDKAVSITADNFPEMRDAQRPGNSIIPIIHLHGTLDATYKITETDVFDSTYDPTAAVFRAALAEADAFVFVGYSMSDPDFRSLYMSHRDAIQGRRRGTSTEDKTTYVVGPARDPFHYELGTEVWAGRGAVWFPLDARTFFEELRLFLEHGSGSTMLKTLKKSYKLQDEGVFRQKVDRIGQTLCLDPGDAMAFMMQVRKRSGGKR